MAQQPGPAQCPYVPLRHDKPCFEERISQTGRAFAICELLKLDRCGLDGRGGRGHAAYRLPARFGTAPWVRAEIVLEDPAPVHRRRVIVQFVARGPRAGGVPFLRRGGCGALIGGLA